MKIVLFFLASFLFCYPAFSQASISRWNCSTYEDAQSGREGYEIEIVEQFQNYTSKSAIAKTSVTEPLGLIEISVIPVKRTNKTWDPDVVFRGRNFQINIDYLFRDFKTGISLAKAVFLNEFNRKIEQTMYCKRKP